MTDYDKRLEEKSQSHFYYFRSGHPIGSGSGKPAGSPPAGSPPAGSPSAGSPPAGSPPAGSPSAGSPPAGSPSVGSPPAGSPSVGSPPAASPPATTSAPISSSLCPLPTGSTNAVTAELSILLLQLNGVAMNGSVSPTESPTTIPLGFLGLNAHIPRIQVSGCSLIAVAAQELRDMAGKPQTPVSFTNRGNWHEKINSYYYDDLEEDFRAVDRGREACSSPTFRQRLRLASSRVVLRLAILSAVCLIPKIFKIIIATPATAP
ncbi:hypothetical protein L9F63_009576, partial [Diploptera punctata]